MLGKKVEVLFAGHRVSGSVVEAINNSVYSEKSRLTVELFPSPQGPLPARLVLSPQGRGLHWRFMDDEPFHATPAKVIDQ